MPIARSLRPLGVLILALTLGACMGYRLVHLDEIEVPTYEPRVVPIPAECDALIERAVTRGVATLSEVEGRTVQFCQQQQMIRAQEEEAAARRLEAHAAAARFGLQLATVIIGALIVVAGWVF
jgi:hypothetical protein